MATNYWNQYDTGGTTSNFFPNTTSNDTTPSTTRYFDYFYNDSTPPPRRILIEVPQHWSEDQTIRFVDLVNNQTKTGWRVTMVIKGDILITDPNIERRTMKDFYPLLIYYAGTIDINKIVDFFNENPC